MIIKNALVYGADFTPEVTDIEIENGIIKAIGKTDKDGEDFSGLTVLPGFIDIHIHGTRLADSSSGNADEIATISKALAEHGITSFCPTTMTLPTDTLEKAFTAVADYMGSEEGAYIHGINMEGPYISLAKKGAQAAEHVRPADFDEFSKLNSICPIRLVDIAPETDGAVEFAKKASEICTVSAAHTAASFAEAKLGFENGFTHATHLFNAMTALAHRNPGVVGAALNSDVTTELIVDTFHVNPALYPIVAKLKGDKLCFITDCLPAGGLPEGQYTLGGTAFVSKGIECRLLDGTIAGSILKMNKGVWNVYTTTDLPLWYCVNCASLNPANAIGMGATKGSLDIGKDADIIITDNEFNVEKTIIGGTVRYEA